MAKRPLPTPELLRQLLSYNPATGDLIWLARYPHMFKAGTYPPERRCKSWNARLAGKAAFTNVGSHGYHEGAVENVLFLAHRVIWAMQTGEWPVHDIDHIDGRRTNNQWTNLRAVTHAINLRNAAGKSNNTSGVTGVSWRPDKRKWRARVMVSGHERSLGHFDRFEDAVAAREAAMAHDGFTDRHGIFG